MTEQDGGAVTHIPGEDTSTLLKLIAAIRRRPTMFLSKRYISCLQSYLDGWRDQAYHCGIDVQDHCLVEFQEWIVAKYDVTSSHSWSSIILFYSEGEGHALDNFFKLFEQWQQETAAA